MAEGNLNLNTAATLTIGAASVQSANLIEGGIYSLISTTAAWLAIGSNPTAVAAAATAQYIQPNYPVVFIAPAGTNKIALIQDTAGGKATLTLCTA